MRQTALLLLGLLGACGDPHVPDPGALVPEPGEERGGGAATNDALLGEEAFSQPAPNLDAAHLASFLAGRDFFTSPWVTATTSTDMRDGLGPTFNAPSCDGCHLRDGRGRPPDGNGSFESILIRLSIPGADAHGGPLDEPSYGGQFQPRAIVGVPSEGLPGLAYEEVEGAYGDGEPYVLRRPSVVFASLAFGPMDPEAMTSLRVAPAVFGLGLLELVPEADLLALEDPDDADGDGISGRANRVWSVALSAMAIGRFGWKAGQPTVREQTAAAFRGDMGITSALFPDEDCPAPQTECASSPSGGEPELAEAILEHVSLYGLTLAVPVRTEHGDPEVLHGRELFRDAGCAACHVERFVTGVSEELPELSQQTIRPFTDLLLHDMGEGLADDRPEFLASGREWRTPPLWGVGRVDDVNGHTLLLHDGRARGFEEAILWHGGEAEDARERFRAMPADDRDALVRFLESL